MSRALILLAVLVALLAPPAAAGAKPSGGCASGGVTLAATAQVRVYSTGRGKLDRVAACGMRTGTTTELGDYGTCARAGQIDRKIAIAGKGFAVSGFACPRSAIIAWVAVYDADTGKSVKHDAVTGSPTGGDVDEQVTSLVLARDGAVAWIAQLNRGNTL
jgi:hypothetical protein